ncbi:MAG: tetratricopeptide repeat protein [Limisphaerales bacterium]
MITNLAVLAFAGLAFWWLSGFDSKVTGGNKRQDYIRRAARCGITLFLLGMLLGLPGAVTAVPLLLLIGGMFALAWAGCIAELFARWFHHLVDPEDKREFDPNQNLRDLDMIASLVKNGRREEAVQLCQMLKESGDVSVLALETMLEHLGIKQESVQKPKPLTEAYHLRTQGRFQEAESILKLLLAEDPCNVDAAMMLMRIYAQDLHHPHQAVKILQALEKQPHVSPAHVEFARRSIGEWSQAKPKPEKVDAPPESIDELLAQGYLGTVIEILEQKIGEQPRDLDLRLKLAEVYAQRCGDVHRAEKIVRQIETSPGFTPEQARNARTKLGEWRNAGTRRH